MNKIAFFDFDGTITTKDSLFKFILFAVGSVNFILGLLVLSPVLVLFKLKLIPNYKAKQKMFSWFFKGYDEYLFKQIAEEYSLNHIDKILNLKAIQKLNWHKQHEHKIVVVSASIDCWLRPWCEKNGLELLSTKIEFRKGKVTGKFLTKNCYGQEKVNRIKERYDLDNYDFMYAYGDSKGDKEMLELANQSFYQLF